MSLGNRAVSTLIRVGRELHAQRRAEIAAKVEAIRAKALTREDYYREVGRVFGYPECCIEFFAQVWTPMAETHGKGPFWRRYMDRAHVARFNRIPCPGCLRAAEEALR